MGKVENRTDKSFQLLVILSMFANICFFTYLRILLYNIRVHCLTITVFICQLGDPGSRSQVTPPVFKNFSISLKEKTISELVQDKWLNCTPDGFVNLGVRSFLDLRSWFRSNDVPSCEVCNEAGVKVLLLIGSLFFPFFVWALFLCSCILSIDNSLNLYR